MIYLKHNDRKVWIGLPISAIVVSIALILLQNYLNLMLATLAMNRLDPTFTKQLCTS